MEATFQVSILRFHNTVSHTYEAQLWQKNIEEYSFLPLSINRDKASIPFDGIPPEITRKISGNVKGKYPVLLNDDEIRIVISQLDTITETKVLKIITNLSSVVASGQGSCGTKHNKPNIERVPKQLVNYKQCY